MDKKGLAFYPRPVLPPRTDGSPFFRLYLIRGDHDDFRGGFQLTVQVTLGRDLAAGPVDLEPVGVGLGAWMIKFKKNGNNKNQTWDGWVGSPNATSVLCHPPPGNNSGI